MAKILLRKRLDGCLAPTDEECEEVLKRHKVGSEFWVEIKKARNPKYHRMYMALLRIVYENQERYTNFRIFRKAVELAAGHVEIIPSLDGEPHIQVQSIAWDALDEHGFQELFPQVMRVCVDGFLKGVGLDELRQEVERHAA